MTAAELIEELQKAPGNTQVRLRVFDDIGYEWWDELPDEIDRVTFLGPFVLIEPRK